MQEGEWVGSPALVAQLVQHPHRQVDADEVEPALAQRQGDPSGTHTDLETGPRLGQDLGQAGHACFDLFVVASGVVVALRDPVEGERASGRVVHGRPTRMGP